MVDVMFISDFIAMFFTTYLNRQGQEETNSIMIAINYSTSARFLFDFSAVLGTDAIT